MVMLRLLLRQPVGDFKSTMDLSKSCSSSRIQNVKPLKTAKALKLGSIEWH